MKNTLTFLISLLMLLDLQGQTTEPITKIPFELEGEHLFIKLSIDNSDTLEFVFDTGAGATVINAAVAEKLDLSVDKTIENTGAAGKVTAGIVRNKPIAMKGLVIPKVDLQKASLSHLEQSFGRDLDGIIGYDLLKKFVIQINYDRSELLVFKSKGFKYVGNGEMIKLDLGHVPTAVFPISLRDGVYTEEEFILDNGAGLAIAFTTPFSEKNQVKKAMGKTYPNNARGFSANVAEIDIGRVRGLKILDHEFNNVPASVYNTKVGVFAHKGIAGILGNEILKRFNITFDYQRKRSYWEPNHQFVNDSFDVSHSGIKLKLNADRSKVIIDHIIPESAAADSELEIEDEIIEIDGMKSSNHTLIQLRNALNQNGKKVKIRFIQRNQEKEVSILLKPLI